MALTDQTTLRLRESEHIERFVGVRSELLHAALLITQEVEDDILDALADVEENGPGYPI